MLLIRKQLPDGNLYHTPRPDQTAGVFPFPGMGAEGVPLRWTALHLRECLQIAPDCARIDSMASGEFLFIRDSNGLQNGGWACL